MKNPNWRRRDHQDTKSDPLVSLPLRPHVSSRTTSRGLCTHSDDHMLYQSFNDTDSEACEVIHVDRDSSESQESVTQSTKSANRNGAEIESGPTGLCEVTANDSIKISHSSAPFRLIEVVPLHDAQGSSLDASARGCSVDLAKVQRMHRTSNGVTHRHCDDLDAQLMEALRASSKTPPRIHTKHHASKPNIHPCVQEKIQLNNNEAILRELGSTDINHLQNTVKTQQSKLKISLGSPDVDNSQLGEQHQPPDEQDANLAFQKMLQKLRRRSDRSKTGEEGFSKLGGSPAQVAGQPSTTPSAIMKSALRNQRKTDTTDSDYSSGPSTTSTASTKATSISSSGFNPRAREFFSFSGKEPAIPEEYQHQKFRRLPVADLFKQSAQQLSTGTGRHDNVGEQRLYDFNVMPQSACPTPESMDSWKVLLGSLIHSTGVSSDACADTGLPMSSIAAWPAGQISPLMFPMGLPTLGMPAPSFTTAFPGAGSTCIQGTQPHGCAEGTAMPISMPLSQIPGSTMPPVAGSSAQPRYVPKPRNPDPTDQLAYEAWIEWRKAHEPGYAMECKMRQRRRAQRLTMTKPKCGADDKTDAIISEATPCIT